MFDLAIRLISLQLKDNRAKSTTKVQVHPYNHLQQRALWTFSSKVLYVGGVENLYMKLNLHYETLRLSIRCKTEP